MEKIVAVKHFPDARGIPQTKGDYTVSDFISSFVCGGSLHLGFQGTANPGRGAGIPRVRKPKKVRYASLILTIVVLLIGGLLAVPSSMAQSTSAGVSGRVTDSTGAVIVDAEVIIKNVETGLATTVRTNRDGLYNIPALARGEYVISASKPGFKSVTVTDLTLNVQDNVIRNFSLQVGSISETVTINGNGLNINTTDAAVGTVVDHQFVENTPLNGRSFQNLLTLSPGVAVVGNFGNGSNGGVGVAGDITVNGQRTEANYFTVDGVSVNTGTAASGSSVFGAGIAGATPGETVLGTTQSLVSVDALQEFRATTSTYSAEYGRTPGGQFAFTTRSGTNDWHGSVYDYFRNDALDGNNWFNNSTSPQIPRLPERQNDFGATLGGPILIPGIYNGKDRTFFFFSYEGLRLTVPQASQRFSVPDLALRQQAPAALQPFLNAFPIPHGGEDGLNDGLAFYNLAYSSPSSLDNYGIRIDHSFGERVRVFARYAYTPSSSWNYFEPSVKQTSAINVKTLTVGAVSSISPTQANDLRFNITQSNMNFDWTLTSNGGATPFDIGNLTGPTGKPATIVDTSLFFSLQFGGFPSLFAEAARNGQRQYNVVDTHTWSYRAHQFKVGIDWRRLTTVVSPIGESQDGFFFSEASVLANSADLAFAGTAISPAPEPVYHNFSLFLQDEWKATHRLSLSLGLRWDINPAPGNLSGPSPYTVDQVRDLTTTKLAAQNAPLWKTDWHGLAPRVGLAYQLRQASGRETVLRTGFGIFYDMGSAQGSEGFLGIGFNSFNQFSGVPLPLTANQVMLPPASVAAPYNNANVYAFDPNLKLPYTMQWNLAVEQRLGVDQTLTVGYVGSGARRLLTQFQYYPSNFGNSNFSPGVPLFVTSNRADSAYNALQLKYQKRLSHGLQALGSYTWSHSIDNASNNFQLYELLRASSDFDIRHNFQAAVTYDIPGSNSNALLSAVLKNWALDARVSASSALPVDIIGTSTIDPVTGKSVNFHPNLVPGQPLYIYSSQYPGGRIINYNAFSVPASGVGPGATAEGDTPRNDARGFDAVQVDLALRRDFPIHERLRLQLRTEAFNLLNHPIFGAIYNHVPYGPSLFGHAYQTLNASLGGLSPLYQVGGARSLQIALKLQF